MHLDDGTLQRLIDGEDAGDAAGARAHLTTCAACRERLAAATGEQAEVDERLGQLDAPAPSRSWADIAPEAASGARGAAFRWVAGFVVALGLAGAAWAIPGSPLRAWVGAAIEWVSERGATAPGAPTDAEFAGISMAPGDRLTIVFAASESGGVARVTLTDAADVVVRAPRNAARFTSESERLVIEPFGSPGTFEIGIPRGAPLVAIEVGGVQMLLKRGEEIQTHPAIGPRASDPAARSYLIPLDGSNR